MHQHHTVLLEGYTPSEILHFTQQQLDAFVFTGQPLSFRIGSATILGEFRHSSERLTIELAHIDGGGEGILPTLWLLAERYAVQHHKSEIAWIVHALRCANPNPKLRRVLERRGFTIQHVPQIGEAYYYLHTLKADGNDVG